MAKDDRGPREDDQHELMGHQLDLIGNQLDPMADQRMPIRDQDPLVERLSGAFRLGYLSLDDAAAV